MTMTRNTPTVLANMLFWFQAHNLSLADHVTITKIDADRAWGWPEPALRGMIGDGCGSGLWERDCSGPAGYFHGAGTESFREAGAVMPAMQICFHVLEPRDWNESTYGLAEFVEIDFDFANPVGGDLASTVVHLWEVVSNAVTGGKTPQERIWKGLQKRFSSINV